MIKYLSPKKVYLPYYTCDAVLEPFIKADVQFEYYSINEKLEPETFPELVSDEYFLYIDYFGIKGNVIQNLIGIYGDKLIIDNTHNFFWKTESNNWAFTSARKYFGIPDGAYLYSPVKISDDIPRFRDISISHHLNRLLGNQEIAFKQYVEYEKKLSSEVFRVSEYSERILNNLDYENIAESRKSNFRELHNGLKKYNTLSIEINPDAIPFCYPFLPSKKILLQDLHKRKIFIPQYWKDVNERGSDGFEFEKDFSSRLLPLPMDHRYSRKEMLFVADVILSRL